MRPVTLIKKFITEAENELYHNILPFWAEKTTDLTNGGFLGKISRNLTVSPNAEKSCILNSRILWTFSAAYRMRRQISYLAIAKRAFDYLRKYFWDDQHSGLYFMVNHLGMVSNSRKQLYNLAFGIYGLTEYYLATGVKESLDLAKEIYRLIEKYGYDPINKGYFEAFSRDWQSISDMRLSTKDLNEQKSMNTHLHLLEAYTNLVKATPADNELKSKLSGLVNIMVEQIIDQQTYHFRLFFDEVWNSKTTTISYGHDIEGSWLIGEAAKVLGDTQTSDRVYKLAVNIAKQIYQEGLDREYGGLFNECSDGIQLPQKEWWPQSEAIVGFLNAFQLTGEEHFFEIAYELWLYSQTYFVDKVYGEWFYMLTREGLPIDEYEKVGPWKCPYHNGRACMEIITRLSSVASPLAI